MKKLFCVIAALFTLVMLTAGNCGGSTGPNAEETQSSAPRGHGSQVKFAMVSYGGYPSQFLTITDEGVTANIEGCKVEFSGNEQEANPAGRTPNPSAPVQAYAEFWALSIAGKQGKDIPEALRASFWYDGHFVTNVPYETLQAAVLAALRDKTLTCN